eukprot:9483345-Pyramimonas_sp.AAC.1
MQKKFLIIYWRAKCTSGDNRLALVTWSIPIGRYAKVIAGRPAGRLATNANAVRNAVLSEPTSRVTRASMCSECNASPYWTCISRFPIRMITWPPPGSFRTTGKGPLQPPQSSFVVAGRW